MKKMFFRSLALVGAVFVAACSDSSDEVVPTPPQPTPQPEESFVIELGVPTAVSVNVTVTPADDEALYYYDVLPKEILNEHHSGDLAVYMKNMMAEAVKNFGSVEEALARLADTGV